jgi:hypothetical protein
MKQQENSVFYVALAAIIVIQRCGKHISTTIEGLHFLLGPYRGVIFRKTGATQARKIGMICFAKSVLTDNLYIM